MKKNIFICGLIGALALSACSKTKEEKGTEPLSCDNPQLSSEIHKSLQSAISSDIHQFVQRDGRHIVDIDKVLAAANELNVSFSAVELGKDSKNNSICNSQLNITVPASVWQQTQTYAPLVIGKTNFADHIKQQLESSGFTLNDNVFSKSFQYTPLGNSIKAGSATNPSTTLGSEYDKTSIQNVAVTIGNALLGYGVKDKVSIGGHIYNRDDAVKLVNNQHAQVPPETHLSQDAQTASAILNAKPVAVPVPVPVVPSNDTNAKSPANNAGNDVSEHALQQARDNNVNANNVINRLWVNMDDTVRKTLRPEEHKWIAQKLSQCQTQAANAKNSAQAEYIRLQCDTKMTNERIKYLNGYSLH